MSNSTQLLDQLRQQHDSGTIDTIDPFILDFCSFWEVIHQHVHDCKVKKITKTAEIAFALKDKFTLPFYEKYRSQPKYDFVEYYPSWMERLATLCIRWRGGGITFPLRLITYELANHNDNLLDSYLSHLLSGEINGSIDTLFQFLFPKLYTMALPLSSSELIMLKSCQLVFNRCQNFFKGPSTKEFVKFIPDLASETIRNKLEQMIYFQMFISANYLDMGKLGFETYLISHYSAIPTQFEKYCLTSVNFGPTRLSVFQIPYSYPAILASLKGYLFQEASSTQLRLKFNRRIHSWNLTNLNKGKNNWTLPISFFYGDINAKPISPAPTMDLSLDPTYEPYRPLTNADIKLLTFITCIGTTFKIKDLSSQLDLHRNTVVKLLSEYHQNQLIQQVLQFNNIGLELPIYIYLKVPKKIDYPFIEQCRTLPCMDLFVAEEEKSDVYFGKVDIPQHWAREFTTRMKTIRETYPDVKLQYSMEPSVLAKWNLSLKETYKNEQKTQTSC